jgi:hypothetical protein
MEGAPRAHQEAGTLDPQPFLGESFLGRPFDAYQNMMQIARSIREASRQLALSRPRVLEVSRRPTQIEEFLPEAEVAHFSTHDEDEEPLPGPPVFPFETGAFDALLITDAYEHIAQQHRPALLAEMVRVTNGLVLVGTPTSDPVVDRFDRVVFDFIWGKTGRFAKPAAQHVLYGHEKLEDIVERVRALGVHGVATLPCNYVYRWIQMLLLYFDTQDGSPTPEIFEPFNRVYNERLAPYDYREPCFRYLVAIGTHPGLDMPAFAAALASPPEPPKLVPETDRALVETWKIIQTREGEQLARFNKMWTGMTDRLQWLERERERLLAEAERAALVDGLERRLAEREGEVEALAEVKQRLTAEVEATSRANEETSTRLSDALAAVDLLSAERDHLARDLAQLHLDHAELSDERARLIEENLSLDAAAEARISRRLARAARKLARRRT